MVLSSQHDFRYLATLLRQPNMLAIVAKKDIQILHSLSQFRSCVLLYFFFFFRRDVVWQKKYEATVGVKAALHML